LALSDSSGGARGLLGYGKEKGAGASKSVIIDRDCSVVEETQVGLGLLAKLHINRNVCGLVDWAMTAHIERDEKHLTHLLVNTAIDVGGDDSELTYHEKRKRDRKVK